MLSKEVGLQILKPKVYKELLVITELYRQRKTMFDRRVKRIDD
ncbi:hypothetical protein [Desulfoluna spongiiphila]|nr:hypothetical protein [Desulfoluna spongiiphila]